MSVGPFFFADRSSESTQYDFEQDQRSSMLKVVWRSNPQIITYEMNITNTLR